MFTLIILEEYGQEWSKIEAFRPANSEISNHESKTDRNTDTEVLHTRNILPKAHSN